MSVISSADEPRSEGSKSMDSNMLISRHVKRMTIEVPKELHAALKKAALHEDRYVRQLVVEALNEYLKNHGHINK